MVMELVEGLTLKKFVKRHQQRMAKKTTFDGIEVKDPS